MKLIGSISSPYVRKVRVVMAEKKLEYEFVLEDVWAATTTIARFNPLGKVPCLVMEDGGAVFDSRVIVEYLDTLTPVGKLIPTAGRERAEVKCWEALGDGLLEAAVLVRLENSLRAEAQRSDTWVKRQKQKIEYALDAMAGALADNAFCTGTHYTLADISVGCALGYLDFRFPENPWRGTHPNLARLFEKLSERPSFKETAPA